MPEIAYYTQNLKKHAEMTNESSRMQIQFFQHILLTSSSILGIVVALHPKSEISQIAAGVFVGSTLSLLGCIISTLIILHDYTMLAEDCKKAFHKEITEASKANREIETVAIDLKNRTKICKKITLIFFILALLLLIVYTII